MRPQYSAILLVILVVASIIKGANDFDKSIKNSKLTPFLHRHYHNIIEDRTRIDTIDRDIPVYQVLLSNIGTATKNLPILATTTTMDSGWPTSEQELDYNFEEELNAFFKGMFFSNLPLRVTLTVLLVFCSINITREVFFDHAKTSLTRCYQVDSGLREQVYDQKSFNDQRSFKKTVLRVLSLFANQPDHSFTGRSVFVTQPGHSFADRNVPDHSNTDRSDRSGMEIMMTNSQRSFSKSRTKFILSLLAGFAHNISKTRIDIAWFFLRKSQPRLQSVCSFPRSKARLYTSISTFVLIVFIFIMEATIASVIAAIADPAIQASVQDTFDRTVLKDQALLLQVIAQTELETVQASCVLVIADEAVDLYSAFPDTSFALKAIRFERKLELGQEGHRYYDLQRWDKVVSELNRILEFEKTNPWGRYMYGSAVVDSVDVNYPIPQRQIDISNGNLVQNR